MKTKLKIYKLHFTTPLHIGDERNDYSISLKTYQSDAMYAALTSCLAKVEYTIPKDGDLGFSISSLFPFYQEIEKDKEPEKKAVYFFPKLLKQNLPNLNDLSNAKKIKKVSWLEISFFEQMINGTLRLNDDIVQQIKGDFLCKNETYINKDFITSQVVQRVTISRDFSKDAEPFYMDKIYFIEKSGLFFIAEGDTKLLDIALSVLKEEGIGTDRNIGNGFFNVSTDEIEINLPESEYIANLSMFCPENETQLADMMRDDNIAYDFTKRGGWITTMPHNKIRKNTIHMFTPASVFKSTIKQKGINIMGKLIDLNPSATYPLVDHSIWRNGKSLFIPVKI